MLVLFYTLAASDQKKETGPVGGLVVWAVCYII